MRRCLLTSVATFASLVVLSGCPIFGLGDGDDEAGPKYWAVELNGSPLNGPNATAEVTLEAQDTRGTPQAIVFSQFGIELLSGGRFYLHSTYRTETGSGSGSSELGHYSRNGEQITFTPEKEDSGLDATGTVREPTMTLSGYWIARLYETDAGEVVFARFPIELVLRRE
jgi:hypothetical protein